MSSWYCAVRKKPLAEYSGSPNRAASSVVCRLVALPCQTLMLR
jgi:hypothetical protein